MKYISLRGHWLSNCLLGTQARSPFDTDSKFTMTRNESRLRVQSDNSQDSAGADAVDPDFANYFLVRQRSNDSLSVSPKFAAIRPKNSKSHKSTESERGRRGAIKSISGSSSMSGPSKSRYIEEWNDKNMDVSSPPGSWDEPRHPADPPRPAKPGMEWVWFPQGYWAERELHAMSPRDSIPSKQSGRQKWWNRTPEPKTPTSVPTDKTEGSAKSPPKTTPPKFEIPRIKIGSISRRNSSIDADRRRSSSQKSLMSMQLGGFSFIKQRSNNRDGGDTPDGEAPLGLYCRTKKNLREMLLERTKLVCSPASYGYRY